MTENSLAPEDALVPSILADFSLPHLPPDIALSGGWAAPEGEICWALGAYSEITIGPARWAHGQRTGRILAIIRATPYLGQNLQARQRVGISVNGTLAREVSLERAGLLAFWLPAEYSARPLIIGFDHPDACSPADVGAGEDQRRFAFAFHALQLWHIPEMPRDCMPPGISGPVPGDILGRFESLGDNCEFGIAQRLAGNEPLALLRFAAAPLGALISGLLNEFADFGDAGFTEIDIRGDKREYILTEHRYNLTYHTFTYEDQMPEARVLSRESRKLELLSRRMLDDLRTARRIYIVKQNTGLAEGDVYSLFLLLRRFGPNRLIHVALADAAHPAGTVEMLLPGLLRGYITRFAPYDAAADVLLDEWLTLCHNAEAVLQTA